MILTWHICSIKLKSIQSEYSSSYFCARQNHDAYSRTDCMRDNWYWFQIMRKSKIECNKWIRQLYLLCPAQFLGSRKVSSSLCGSLFGQVDVKLQGHGDKTWLHWDPTCQFYPCQSDGTSWKTPWGHPRQRHIGFWPGSTAPSCDESSWPW